jgi:hypothetical protein
MTTAVRDVSIAAWEFPMIVLYLFLVGIVFSRRKRKHIGRHPEYKYYLWGLYAKILGGFAFTMVYMYHYRSGDVFAFFASSKVLSKLFFTDPGRFFEALFAENTVENYYRLFDQRTGYPVNFIYWEDRTYMLVRLITPLTLLTGQSFLLTTALVSTLTYHGVWCLYRTLLRYYPSLQGRLAFAILFFPSSVFWGSAILKDTFTFTGLCYYVHAVDMVFFRRERPLRSWALLILGSMMMVLMKPYVFMVLFPASLFWLLYHRVQRLRNGLLRMLALPAAMGVLAVISFGVMERMKDQLGKFSLDQAINTIMASQADLKRVERYGSNFFDLGNIEPTWQGVLSKFPQATFAGLFRPSMLDVTNVTMLISALENTYLLFLTLMILWRTRVVFFFTLLGKNPMLQMSFVFSVFYAFVIAISTPNFGAMVRFKIPLLPMFVSALFITSFILERRKEVMRRGGRFDFSMYTNGEPQAGATGTSAGVSSQGHDRTDRAPRPR